MMPNPLINSDDLIKESDAIFNEAIDRGVLIYHPEAAVNFAGNWMLIGVKEGTAYFKHCETKEYLHMRDVKTKAKHFKWPSINNLMGLALLLIVAFPNIGWADKNEASNVATNGRSSIADVLTGTVDANTTPGYSGTDLQQNKYNHDTLIDGNIMPLDNTSESARQTLSSQPNWDLSPGVADSALAIQGGPSSVEDLGNFLSGSYTACDVPPTPAKTPAILQLCDEWPATNEQKCTPTITHSYQNTQSWSCKRDATRIRKKCSRTLTKKCSRQYTSQDVSEVMNNLDTDGLAAISNSDGSITIGKSGADYWGGHCQIFDQNLTFNINDLSAIQNFTLDNLRFDDWTHVKVNGTPVYVGPHGGTPKIGIKVGLGSGPPVCHQRDEYGICTGLYNSTIKIVRYQDSASTVAGSCELKTNWNINANVNILPYLREGSNTIETRTIVTGTGEFQAKFSTRFSKCRNFTETWSETCED